MVWCGRVSTLCNSNSDLTCVSTDMRTGWWLFVFIHHNIRTSQSKVTYFYMALMPMQKNIPRLETNKSNQHFKIVHLLYQHSDDITLSSFFFQVQVFLKEKIFKRFAKFSKFSTSTCWWTDMRNVKRSLAVHLKRCMLHFINYTKQFVTQTWHIKKIHQII